MWVDVLTTKYTELDHFVRCKIRFKLRIKIFTLLLGEVVSIIFLKDVVYNDEFMGHAYGFKTTIAKLSMSAKLTHARYGKSKYAAL